MAHRPGGTRGKSTLIAMTAIAAPVALAFETLLRYLLFPAELEILRNELRPVLTVVAWILCVVCAIAGTLGILLQDRLAARAVERLPGRAKMPAEVERARVGAFLLAASVPQVPAILATFSFMFGASFLPVAVAIVVVTSAVLVQAARVRAP